MRHAGFPGQIKVTWASISKSFVTPFIFTFTFTFIFSFFTLFFAFANYRAYQYASSPQLDRA